MIESLDLTKFYGKRCVVDHVSFEVKSGDVLGFLGPNGAGKSTTMKMISGFLCPSAGIARIDGLDVLEKPIEARKRLGYLPENGPLYEEMTVEEFLRFASDVRNQEKDLVTRLAHVERVLETCQLKEVRKQTIDTLSKGFHQRVGVAQAIIHDPKYLILDEPTDGLDPNQKNEIRALLRDMATDKAIIMSTHILEEVDAVCNRVIIIAEGKVIVDATPGELRKQHPDYGGLRIEAEDVEPIRLELRKQFPDWKVEQRADQVVIRSEKKENVFSPVYTFLREKNLPVHDIHKLETPLDEVFRKLTLNS